MAYVEHVVQRDEDHDCSVCGKVRERLEYKYHEDAVGVVAQGHCHSGYTEDKCQDFAGFVPVPQDNGDQTEQQCEGWVQFGAHYEVIGYLCDPGQDYQSEGVFLQIGSIFIAHGDLVCRDGERDSADYPQGKEVREEELAQVV